MVCRRMFCLRPLSPRATGMDFTDAALFFIFGLLDFVHCVE